MAFSTLIEQSRLLDRFEDAVVREVARKRELDRVIAPPEPNALEIQQLEISAQVRVAMLEQRKGVEGVIARLGGVAPIGRGALAPLINDLADRLPAASEKPAPIVAIDIDLAPLEGGATSSQERDAMLLAMEALRKKAHIIVVTLPREAGPKGGRKARNDFMRDAKCTRLSGPVVSEGDAVKVRHALFFASPRLFHQADSYPTKFPYQLRDDHTPDLPPHYPSLGTLIQLQFDHQFTHHASPVANLTPQQHATLLPARQTLTTLCEQAHASRPDDELLEDRMATPAAEKIAEAYKEWRYSWRLLDDPRLQQTVIDDVRSKGWAKRLDDSVIERPVLLLGIDGGASYDKFGIAGISSEAVSGASLHALQALSIKAQPRPIWEKFASIFVDGVLGVLYGLIWHKIFRPPLKRVRQNMPVIGSWLVVAIPIAIGAFLIWLCFQVVAIWMGIDFWVNPLYIIASLLLGIYVDAWRDSEASTQEERDQRDRLFGLPVAWDALRSGFGERLGAPALADAVLSAALRLIVLVAGWSIIFYELLKVVMS